MPHSVQTSLGRITHKSFGKENPFDVIFSTVNGNNPLSEKNYVYLFKNVQRFKSESEDGLNLIYGEIYKSKLQLQHTLFDKKNLTFKPELFDELYYTSRFVIFIDLSIVFTSSQKYDADFFIKTFEELYKLNTSDALSSIKIRYRREDVDIFNRIKSYARLVSVELIGIRKSNPAPIRLAKKMEDFLDREQTDVYNGKFVSEKEQGLARDPESHIISGAALAVEGYGDLEIAGITPNGAFDRIKLSDKVIRKPIKNYDKVLDFVVAVKDNYGKYISKEDDLTYDK